MKGGMITRAVKIPVKKIRSGMLLKMNLNLVLVAWYAEARAFRATITFDDCCCKYRNVVGVQLYASDPEIMEKMLLDVAQMYPPKESMNVVIPDVFTSCDMEVDN